MTYLFRNSFRAWIVLFLGFSHVQAQQNSIFSYSFYESPDSTLEVTIYCDSPDSALEFINVQIDHDQDLEYSHYELENSWFNPDGKAAISVDTTTLPNTILCTLERNEGEELSGTGIVLRLVLSGHGIIENIDLKRKGLKLGFNAGEKDVSISPIPIRGNESELTLRSNIPIKEFTIRSFEGIIVKSWKPSLPLITQSDRFAYRLKVSGLPNGVYYITSEKKFIGKFIIL